MAALGWEDMLAVVAGPGQTPVKRADVAQDGKSASWFANGNYIWSRTPTTSQFDCYMASQQPINLTPGTDGFYLIIGVNLNWGMFNDPSQPYYQFLNNFHGGDHVLDILSPLVFQPYQNDNTSVWSFDAASLAIRGAENFLQYWYPQFNQWASAIGDTGSDWQGSAAGEFKMLLATFATDLNKFMYELQSGGYADSIDHSRQTLQTVNGSLWNAGQSWLNSGYAWPAIVTADAMKNVTYTVTKTGNRSVSVTTNLGDPSTQDFQDRLQSMAKQEWLKWVAQYLDPAANQGSIDLNAAYTDTVNKLNSPPASVPFQLPQGAGNDPNAALDNSLVSLGNSLSDGFSAMGNSVGNGFSSLGGDLTGAGGKGLPGVGGNGFPSITGNMGNGKNSPFTSTGIGSGVYGGGFGSGYASGPNEDMITDGNGNPLYRNGLPILAPFGATIGADGSVLGPDGQPVKVNGKDLKVPPGSSLTEAEYIYGPDGKQLTDAHGNPLTVPSGSTVGPDGTVLGKGGKPLLVNGKPLQVAKGSTVGSPASQLGLGTVPPGSHVAADGTVIGPDGHAVLVNGQPMHVPVGSTISPTGEVLPPGFTSSVGGSFADPLGGLVPGVGGGFGKLLNAPPGTSVGTMSDPQLGARAARVAGNPFVADPGMTPAEAQLASAEQMAAEAPLAAESAALAGGGLGGEGMPMMPPMMGGMGGMGGGAPGNGEKARTTWLSEDEETWGAHSKAPDGVIGRRPAGTTAPGTTEGW